MVLRSSVKYLPKTMTALAATICRIPNARLEIPARIRVSPRTVENWLSGSTEPRAGHLIALMREFDEVADAVLEASNRNQPGLTHAQRTKLLSILGEK